MGLRHPAYPLNTKGFFHCHRSDHCFIFCLQWNFQKNSLPPESRSCLSFSAGAKRITHEGCNLQSSSLNSAKTLWDGPYSKPNHPPGPSQGWKSQLGAHHCLPGWEFCREPTRLTHTSQAKPELPFKLEHVADQGILKPKQLRRNARKNVVQESHIVHTTMLLPEEPADFCAAGLGHKSKEATEAPFMM